jgi:cupin 2 domain-containing protein
VNLLFPLPDARANEQVEALLTRPGLRVERIVSQGQASPPGFWYDQAEGEFVLLLAGTAKLRFADEAEARLLGPGDWVDINPHRRHRIEWTDPATPTVWLAAFYGSSPRVPRVEPPRTQDQAAPNARPTRANEDK